MSDTQQSLGYRERSHYNVKHSIFLETEKYVHKRIEHKLAPIAHAALKAP